MWCYGHSNIVMGVALCTSFLVSPNVCRGGREPGLFCKWNCSIMTRKVTFFILRIFLVIWHGDPLPPI